MAAPFAEADGSCGSVFLAGSLSTAQKRVGISEEIDAKLYEWLGGEPTFQIKYASSRMIEGTI